MDSKVGDLKETIYKELLEFNWVNLWSELVKLSNYRMVTLDRYNLETLLPKAKSMGIKVFRLTPELFDFEHGLIEDLLREGVLLGLDVYNDVGIERYLNKVAFVTFDSYSLNNVNRIRDKNIRVIFRVMTLHEAYQAIKLSPDMLELFFGCSNGELLLHEFIRRFPEMKFIASGGVNPELLEKFRGKLELIDVTWLL